MEGRGPTTAPAPSFTSEKLIPVVSSLSAAAMSKCPMGLHSCPLCSSPGHLSGLPGLILEPHRPWDNTAPLSGCTKTPVWREVCGREEKLLCFICLKIQWFQHIYQILNNLCLDRAYQFCKAHTLTRYNDLILAFSASYTGAQKY